MFFVALSETMFATRTDGKVGLLPNRIAMYCLSTQTSALLRTLKGTHPGAAFCIEKQCIGNVKA